MEKEPQYWIQHLAITICMFACFFIGCLTGCHQCKEMSQYHRVRALIAKLGMMIETRRTALGEGAVKKPGRDPEL